MSTEDLTARGYIPTQPFDTTDVPRFSQLKETAKDAFMWELKQFFDYTTTDTTTKLAEIPNIQKFALGAGSGEDSLETVVNMIMAYGDTPDQFPMISITSTSERERKMNLGSNYVVSVQYPPSIVGTELGPFDFSKEIPEGESYLFMEITTWPTGLETSETTSTIAFSELIFEDWSNVTMDELVSQVNKSQALYYQFEKTSEGYLRISTGGPCAVSTPNYIEITDGDNKLLELLGFSLGDSDTYLNTDNPPKNRYGLAADMSINIDVISDDINTRTELADLVYNYFTFYMEKRRFQLLGRSYFDRDQDPVEWYHISFNNQFSWASEMTIPREGGEQYEKIYAVRGSVPIFIEDFVDRALVNEPIFLRRDYITAADSSFPEGDYGGVNYLKQL